MYILFALTGFVVILYLIVLFIGKIPGINNYFFIAAIAILIISIYLILNQDKTRDHYKQLDTWPHTEATIIEEKVAGNRAVLPEVTYEYTVADSIYHGKSNLGVPAFGGRNKRTLTARIALKDLPVGSKLIVAYNPENPVISTTQINPPWNHYMKLGFGGLLYIFALLVLLFKIPFTKKQNKPQSPQS
ncbi:MAG: DUF3592 domain-containing protein [Calditrichaceae bacterium]